MYNIGFTAVEKFNPSYGDAWSKFIEWSRLFQLKELVSIDSSLCPQVFTPENDEDFSNLITNEVRFNMYRNLHWLILRTEHINNKQILAVLHQPNMECKKIVFDNRFEFCGYDLIEDFSGISALSNCGGFDRAFLSSELSIIGLLTNYERAREVQQKLLYEYPDESHADCEIYAIWKMK